ncbi:hypothetical protein FE810_05375 [Thalassotalea litorea]|uniref:Uncharacterized protein n=2 Tax=Thalassotalea litorea TaxID=2020715 RepID=A0A5R9IP98_9GAMM|nr:hypothetical protein FE810_05375 [Thalassotalea litorea]
MIPPSAFASNDSEFYDSIRTLDTLFEVIENSATEHKFKDQGMEFTHYFSSELNRSFIVNDEVGEVCFTYEGSEVLSCFPCKSDEISGACP